MPWGSGRGAVAGPTVALCLLLCSSARRCCMPTWLQVRGYLTDVSSEFDTLLHTAHLDKTVSFQGQIAGNVCVQKKRQLHVAGHTGKARMLQQHAYKHHAACRCVGSCMRCCTRTRRAWPWSAHWARCCCCRRWA